MIRGRVNVGPEVGLHARPAADFVKVAASSGHAVRLTNKHGKKAIGTSILAVLSLGAKHGEELVIEVEGPDEVKVLESLTRIVSGQKTV
jgi:phosphocarrier protein